MTNIVRKNPLPASNKKEALDSAANMSLDFGQLVWIFASKEGNLDLMNSIQKVRSGLQQMRNMNLLLYCQNLNEVVSTNLVELATGATEEMANSLDQVVQVYSNRLVEIVSTTTSLGYNTTEKATLGLFAFYVK